MTLRKRTVSLAFAAAAAVLVTSGAASAQANPTVGPRDRSPCRDPWINIAIRELKGRAPNGRYESGECNIHLYNSGSWNSYAQLKSFIGQTLGSLQSQGGYFGADGAFHFNDDYHNFTVPFRDVRIWYARGMTDGNGNAAPDDGSRLGGVLTLPGGISLRFPRS